MLLPVEDRTRACPASWTLRQIGVTAAGPGPTGRGVTVAVLDSGMDPRHPDFARRRRSIAGMRSFVPGEPPLDRTGHGTHCAGIVAGPARPAGGMRYGVAPDARLLIGRIFGDEGKPAPVSRVLAAIRWAREEGARVISLSVGVPRAPGGPWDPDYERIAGRLLEERPGVLLVAPAGNNSGRPGVILPVENPAACPSVLAVGATDAEGRVARFSHGGLDGTGRIDLAAPGDGILSAWIGGGYNLTSGTSMAVPHVAGAAALWLESEPELTARKLRDRLLEAARRAGDPEDCGAGIVQAPGADGP